MSDPRWQWLLAWIERWTGLPLTEEGARIAAVVKFRRHVDDLGRRLVEAAERDRRS